MAEKGRVMTGARARVLVNGVKVGYARNIRYREEIQYEDIDELDNIEVSEHAPVKYRVSGSIGLYRIVNETLKSKGLIPSVGGSSDEHLTNILTAGVLALAIEDSKTQKVIALLERLVIGGQDTTIDAVGVSGNDADFKAIRVRDESEL